VYTVPAPVIPSKYVVFRAQVQHLC